MRNRKLFTFVGVLVAACLLSSCAAFSNWGDQINRALKGVSATMTTYDQNGQKIDEVRGKSFRISRDDRFDGTDSDGSSKKDSQVLLISVGKSHISHVGSSLILAQDGLINVSDQLPPTVNLTNTDSGTPFLNDIHEKFRNLWKGKAKTIMIRSQNGSPIAIYAGNEVEIYKTDVPKSTAFRIDGKYLFVYRSDYTVYDNDLLS